MEDVTSATSMLSLLGPGALGIARSQGLVTGPDFEPGSSHASRWAGDRSVRVVRDPLLGRATPVVTLVCVGPLGDAMALLSGDQVSGGCWSEAGHGLKGLWVRTSSGCQRWGPPGLDRRPLPNPGIHGSRAEGVRHAQTHPL